MRFATGACVDGHEWRARREFPRRAGAECFKGHSRTLAHASALLGVIVGLSCAGSTLDTTTSISRL
jgi:hypothetical protein